MIVDYLLTIKLFEYAIRICDFILSQEYALIFHLFKVYGLIYLNKSK